MPLLKVEADKLSNNDLVAGVVEEIIDRENLFALLPFTQTNSKAYVYNRENALASVAFADPNDTITESASTFTQVTTNLRILLGDVDVDKFLNTVESDTSNQRAIQIAMKAKALGRAFKDALVNGSNLADPKSFDGIKLLTVSGQTITAGANGAALTLAMLDELKDAITAGADAIMMRSGTWRAYKQLLRALGGAVPEQMMIENFGMSPAHDGVPVIINDFLPINEVQGSNSNTTSIYAMRLNEADGLHGLYGGPNAGIIVEDIGTVQNKDATRTRLKWYAGLALKSTKSLARVKGITNI